MVAFSKLRLTFLLFIHDTVLNKIDLHDKYFYLNELMLSELV